MTDPEHLSQKQTSFVDELTGRCPQMKTLTSLTQSFAALLRPNPGNAQTVPRRVKSRVYRRPMNVVATAFVGLFGVLIAFPAASTYRHGFGMDQFIVTLLVLLVFQVAWLVNWRPSVTVAPGGLILRSAFSRLVIPHAQIQRLILPPESPGLEIELSDGSQSRVTGFGSSMVSRMLGNRQEHRILKHFKEIRNDLVVADDAPMVKKWNWYAIIFPAVTAVAFLVALALG